MIQLERNSTKQGAIQHAVKWNKSQFPPRLMFKGLSSDHCSSIFLSFLAFLPSSHFISVSVHSLSFDDYIWWVFIFLNCWSDEVLSFFLVFFCHSKYMWDWISFTTGCIFLRHLPVAQKIMTQADSALKLPSLLVEFVTKYWLPTSRPF